MNDTNFTVLIGRLTRNAELKYTSGGKAVSKFSIAVNEKRKTGEEWKDNAGFFEITLWGKIAESLQLYLTKGKQVAVTGKLTQERWADNDGQNRSKVTVTASTIQLLGSNANTGNGSGEDDPTLFSAAEDGFSDDIPF